MGTLKKLKKKLKDNALFGLPKTPEMPKESEDDVWTEKIPGKNFWALKMEKTPKEKADPAPVKKPAEESEQKADGKPKKSGNKNIICELTSLQYKYLMRKYLMYDFEQRLNKDSAEAIAWVNGIFEKAGIERCLTPEESTAGRRKRGKRYEPHPWSDPEGEMFHDLVYNKETKTLRPITSTEKRIVAYCSSPWHGYNFACSDLGRANVDGQLYIEQDFKSAAKAIYDHWKSKEKVSKEAAALLKYIKPNGSYIEELPKKKKVASKG